MTSTSSLSSDPETNDSRWKPSKRRPEGRPGPKVDGRCRLMPSSGVGASVKRSSVKPVPWADAVDANKRQSHALKPTSDDLKTSSFEERRRCEARSFQRAQCRGKHSTHSVRPPIDDTSYIAA